MPRVSFLLALLCLPFVVGCEGCRRDSDPEAEDEKEQEAPLEDFSARPAQAFPADVNPLSGGIKPGHWMTASQALKSNKVDARGELLSRASASGANFQTGQDESAQGNVPTLRPVVLPKGQMRRFDYRILAPIGVVNERKRNFLSSRFVSTGRTVFFDTGRQPFNVLSGQEFFFVILTDRPERFAKFQVSDWARPYRDEFAFKRPTANYRIVFPPTKDLLPLAETMLDWTSTAVVLWDDLPPDALTPQQQTAIADWVRFGGQLIVNGAAASDAISRTSLADLLPLQPSGNIELDPDSASELLGGWAVPTDRSTEKQIALLRSQSGRVAVDGRLSGDARTLPNSGSLVLLRQVGSGRVVQPRFDVTSDWLLNWQSYDSFVNSALLARPRRELVESQDAEDGSFVLQRYPDLNTAVADPAMNSRLRITARDAILPINRSGGGSSASAAASRFASLTAIDSSTGVGGWNDDSDAISLCRQILRSESGIEIPESSLVIRSLGYYLLILVPINYLLFRVLGRLEYAWLAVPVIAIGGAVWVARAARLDIGFARSQTEIALLELQPDYHRGHLSRVVAIYNSLSSRYDIEFDTIDAAAAPIRGGGGFGQGGAVLRTGFTEGPMLAGLSVGSNQVRMLHAEQIVDVGGGVVLKDDDMLVNQSSLELLDAVVVEKSSSGQVRVAMVGLCEGGSASKLRFRNTSSAAITDDLPMQTRQMIDRLSSPAAMPAGSMRLVARIDGSLPGMSITPNANQKQSQTILLAHLTHPASAEPKVDVNLIGDLRRVLREASGDGER